MFANLLVATDGSDHANRALNVAIDLAKKYNADLHVVHVLTRDMPSGELERMIEVEHLDDSYHGAGTQINIGISSTLAKHGMMRSGDREARLIAVVGERIAGNAHKIAQDAGIKNVSATVLAGDYANEILKLAEEKKIDMIIMGRRGLSTLKGFMTGSVSHKVSQRADCSVLTVK